VPPVQSGAALPLEGAIAARLLVGHTISTGFRVSYNAPAGGSAVVTGLDVTATQAEPVQCFVRAACDPIGASADAIFYWDSQSTGEGNGVWFSWRGALPLFAEDALVIEGDSGSSITWGWVAFGVVVAQMAT